MKLLLLGDTHFKNTTPLRRKEADFFATQLKKFNSAIDIFEQEKCSYFIQAGDFFDTPNASNYVVGELLATMALRLGKGKFYCVLGQHDVYAHNMESYQRSAIYPLVKAGLVNILGKQGRDCRLMGAFDSVLLHGSSFGESMHHLVDVDDSFHMLVVHAMIGDTPLYYNQELQAPVKTLIDHPQYDLIFCGDYHYKFEASYIINDKVHHILNAGCMSRLSADERDRSREVGCYVYDTEQRTYTWHKLWQEPMADVFDLSTIKTVEEKSVNLDGFVYALQNSSQEKVCWKHIMNTVFIQQHVAQDVQDIIQDTILEVCKK